MSERVLKSVSYGISSDDNVANWDLLRTDEP